MKRPSLGRDRVRPFQISTLVFCPRSAAIGWARRYFEERQRVIPFGLPLRALGIRTFLRVYRNVSVELHDVSLRTPFTPHVENALHVAWRVTHGGPFPTFSGILSARAHSTHATLHFEGTYTPPLGLAGAWFDRLLGRRIALAGATTLLHDIKRYIERLNIDEHSATSFAAFEANRRATHPTGFYGVPLHGSIAMRRDGSYLACSLVLEGDAPGFDGLMPGEMALSPERVVALLTELAKPDLRIAPERSAP